jgi:hypothetical protein
MMNSAWLMKRLFAPIGDDVPNDDLALLCSGENPPAVGALRQRVEFVAMRVDAMSYFKLEVSFSSRPLSESE